MDRPAVGPVGGALDAELAGDDAEAQHHFALAVAVEVVEGEGAFGGGDPAPAVGVVFLVVVLGIAAGVDEEVIVVAGEALVIDDGLHDVVVVEIDGVESDAQGAVGEIAEFHDVGVVVGVLVHVVEHVVDDAVAAVIGDIAVAVDVGSRVAGSMSPSSSMIQTIMVSSGIILRCSRRTSIRPPPGSWRQGELFAGPRARARGHQGLSSRAQLAARVSSPSP